MLNPFPTLDRKNLSKKWALFGRKNNILVSLYCLFPGIAFDLILRPYTPSKEVIIHGGTQRISRYMLLQIHFTYFPS